jgi:hypothetical protein
MQSEILAEVIRGETVESVHRGHLIVVSGDGETIFAKGNPEIVTFIRSSGKPFQAARLKDSGFLKMKSRLPAARIRARRFTPKRARKCSPKSAWTNRICDAAHRFRSTKKSPKQ